MNLPVYAAQAAPIGQRVGTLRRSDENCFRHMFGSSCPGTAPVVYDIFSCPEATPFATRNDKGRLTLYVANGCVAMPVGTELRDEDIETLLRNLPKVNWAQIGH